MRIKHQSLISRTLLAAVCVLSLAIFSFAQEEELIKIKTELVNLDVVVTDRGGQRIRGLRKEDFEVYEDGVRQEITHFAATDRPLRLVLVFDISISMEEVLPVVKREAIKLADSLRPDDKLIVLSFASKVYSYTEWVDKAQAKEKIGELQPEPHLSPMPPTIGQHGYNIIDGNTNLYEAFQYVLEHFSNGNDNFAVIVFSDGVDSQMWVPKYRSKRSALAKEVTRQAEEEWAIFYPVRYKTKQMIGQFPEPAWRPVKPRIVFGPRWSDPGREFFSRVAAITGGKVFEFTTQQDLAIAIQEALSDLRSQYSLAYRPLNTESKNGFHRIKVKVKRPEAVARTREGYRRPQ